MNASKGVFLVFLSALSLCVVNTQPVKSQYLGTVYIGSDGSVYSSTNVTVPIQRVGDVYTLNDSIIADSIVVQRNNIVVDGAGYTLQGGGEIGIHLSYRSNVTIRNVQISGFSYYGIYLWDSTGNTITGNTVTYCMGGIMIQNASNNNVSGNHLTNNLDGIMLSGSSNNNLSRNTMVNNERGIFIYSSSNNTLRNNSASDNNHNFVVVGTELSHFVNDVDGSNTINDKRVYYLVDESDLAITPSTSPGLGFLALVNCARITVQNLELASNGQGVILAYTTESTITQNTITNNRIGVDLYSSSNNIVSGNNVTNNYRGIQLSTSSEGNSILENNITFNGNGIYILDSSQNTITKNNITDSEVGIGFSASSGNMIYHNYFIRNTRQVYDVYTDDLSVPLSVNFWDFGHLLGGNYWSDYAGLDVKSGPNQDQPGSDGKGDTPYIIYENNIDDYPLMPYGSPPAVSIVSPKNRTYTVNDVSLTFRVSEPTSWIGYSLDGQANVTIAGNTTLSDLSDDLHQIVVYVKDADEKTGTSEIIYFTVSQQAAPFPTWIAVAIATIAIAGTALLVYFVKVKKTTGKAEAHAPM